MARYSDANLLMIDMTKSDREIEAQLGIRRPRTPAHWKPRVGVGDVVVLNDFGMEQVFGRTLGLSHMRKLKMRITHVDPESITERIPTFVVEVDNPDINQFLIDDRCFDVADRAASPDDYAFVL